MRESVSGHITSLHGYRIQSGGQFGKFPVA
jgi:hypothetical protein